MHLVHPLSPPLPPSTTTQGEGSVAMFEAPGSEVHYPSDKSQEQHDFEQGRIDYTGKDSFENLIQSSLDRHLEEPELGD